MKTIVGPTGSVIGQDEVWIVQADQCIEQLISGVFSGRISAQIVQADREIVQDDRTVEMIGQTIALGPSKATGMEFDQNDQTNPFATRILGIGQDEVWIVQADQCIEQLISGVFSGRISAQIVQADREIVQDDRTVEMIGQTIALGEVQDDQDLREREREKEKSLVLEAADRFSSDAAVGKSEDLVDFCVNLTDCRYAARFSSEQGNWNGVRSERSDESFRYTDLGKTIRKLSLWVQPNQAAREQARARRVELEQDFEFDGTDVGITLGKMDSIVGETEGGKMIHMWNKRDQSSSRREKETASETKGEKT
ncbi:hypothetical protein KFK09_007486 [Dendrobium nobile]|uniref:Uncharacterized protein n=1 Tax=Dendrobium nobile TaxID=94219 RepID=A0A8T3BWM6_DENNO|nr:hypothetical protein KFK09_007486 [Dendrobium nobile]